MSKKPPKKAQPFADLVREVKATVPLREQQEQEPLTPIADGVWLDADGVWWDLAEEHSSRNVVRERLLDSRVRAVWVDGPFLEEVPLAQREARWAAVEDEFAAQFRRAVRHSGLDVQVGEFVNNDGNRLPVVEVVCF